MSGGKNNGAGNQWVDLWKNLQETIDFTMKYGIFPVIFPLNQSIEVINHSTYLQTVSAEVWAMTSGRPAMDLNRGSWWPLPVAARSIFVPRVNRGQQTSTKPRQSSTFLLLYTI